MSLSAGTRLGPYEVVAPLGAGGMGEVYQAMDTRLQRSVALKVLPDTLAADAGFRARFEREAQAIAQLNHPHICRIHDVGEQANVRFLVMEHIDGETVADRLRRGPMSRNDALTIAVQVCEALDAAHSRGIVHRDLKPGNLMLDRSASGGSTHVKLLDFGLARLDADTAAGASTQRRTMTNVSHPGEVLGTPRYMAPEQLRGEAADARSDIWAVGCLLHEMLTGQDVRARSAIRPVRLERAIAKCLAELPERRWASTKDLAAELRRVQQLLRYRRVVRASVAAAIVAVAVVIAGLVLQRQRRATDNGSMESAHAPLSMVIADFENRTGDPVFTGSLEHALAIGLEGASFVSIFPRQEALASARAIRPDAELNGDIARLVAQRQGVTAVVNGVVSRASAGYVVTVHLIDPVPGMPIASARQTAATKDEVLTAMAAIARELRRAVGDHALASDSQLRSETFTTASLDAAREYAVGQELSSLGDDEQAIAHFATAIRHDPGFGRAYAGWAAAVARLGRGTEARHLMDKALSLRERMTERERLRTEGLDAILQQDHHRSADTFRVLVEKFPADNAGLNNLALSEFRLLDFDRALSTGRRAVQVTPTVRHSVNMALYALYANDLRTSINHAGEALKLSSRATLAYLPLVVEAVLANNLAEAERLYGQMATTGQRGAALAALGQADLAAFRGDAPAASARATRGLAEAESNAPVVAALRLLLAEVAVGRGQVVVAKQHAQAALAVDSSPISLYRVGEIFARTGETAVAKQYVDRLAERRQPASVWYQRLLAARVYASDSRSALTEMEAAFQSERSMWFARYSAGILQLEQGNALAASRHLDWCIEHAPAGFAAFLDDAPTLRYIAEARYWRARALEVTRDSRALAAYDEFIRQRLATEHDLLARDARQRRRALQ